MSLVVFSIVATICSVVIPWMIQSPGDNEKSSYTARPPQSLEPLLKGAKWRKPSLLTAWACGNLLFASSMIFAPMVQSANFATLLLALCGVSNAIAGLAPGTFLGVEVNRMSSSVPTSHSRTTSSGRLSNDSIELGLTGSPPNTLHLRHDSTSSISSSSTGELSGIYLGILNIYTTLPQFVGTAISWVVFSILEPGKSPELAKEVNPDEHPSKDGLSGIGVCLFVGALSAVVAAWSTRRLRGAY
jgi:solute carrier family 45 protein 1/2/4